MRTKAGLPFPFGFFSIYMYGGAAFAYYQKIIWRGFVREEKKFGDEIDRIHSNDDDHSDGG